MNFWTGFILVVVASAVVFFGLSINGVTAPEGGHDDHGGHGHH